MVSKTYMVWVIFYFDDWFVLNKLTPNKKKCETIFFAKQVNIKKCSGPSNSAELN